jgi:hypothetical protein
MAWGGSLNKDGSNHIRKLREAGKIIEFLEKFKEDLNDEDKKVFQKAIEIIIKYTEEISTNKE